LDLEDAGELCEQNQLVVSFTSHLLAQFGTRFLFDELVSKLLNSPFHLYNISVMEGKK
jgi:hypothetical protein